VTSTRQLKVASGDVAANTKRGGDLRVTLSPKTVGSTSGFGGVLRLATGELVTEHYHPHSEEFLHVVAGELEMTIDDVPVRLGAGDSLFVPIGARHRLVNVGATEAHAVFHLSPLAPRPDLGHVDTEPTRRPEAPYPEVAAPDES
jgi:putative monooxygenase